MPAKKTKSKKTNSKKAKFKRPVFHHALLKTSRMDEMIEWYRKTVGAEANFYAPGIAFLSNDGANHRLSLIGNPQFRDNPEFRKYAGLHHLAFEYKTVDGLLDTWQRLLDEFGYEPHVAVHHGMTLSFYYVDPDGNSVELQADNYGDSETSSRFIRTDPQFAEDPIGKPVDPGALIAARQAGTNPRQLHERAYAGEFGANAPIDLRLPPPPPAV